MVAGASISMPFFLILRLFLVRKNGCSPVRFFHPCCGSDEFSLKLLAAAQSCLICLEELLSNSAPIISFLLPAYLPLVSAYIFACSNLTPRILSLLTPKQQRRPCLVFTLDPIVSHYISDKFVPTHRGLLSQDRQLHDALECISTARVSMSR
jgi:hypothetical protein